MQAKCVIRAMDKVISDHVAWDDWEAWNNLMGMFFTEGDHIFLSLTRNNLLIAFPSIV